jgi:hypothetical protein
LKSQQAAIWESLESGLPENIVLNHPDEKLPLQDLLSRVDGVITGWSSTAIQSVLSGVPVVTYDSEISGFPSDIIGSGRTKEQYFANLSELTNGGSSVEAVAARNWLVHSKIRGSIKLTGRLFSTARMQGPHWVPKLFNGVDRYFFWIWRPLETILTVRKTKDGKRLTDMILMRKPNLY